MKKFSLLSCSAVLLSVSVAASLSSCASSKAKSDQAASSATNTADIKTEAPTDSKTEEYKIDEKTAEKKDESKSNELDPYGLMTCGHLNETRTMALKKVAEGGCELIYEKGRTSKKISWSSHSVQPCMNSREKVRKELEAAGWKCIQD